jgi:hypothetical protein
MGDFGSIMAGSIESGNGPSALGYAGTVNSLPSDLNDGVVLSGVAKHNIIMYTSPR